MSTLDDFFGKRQQHSKPPLGGRYHHVVICGDKVILSRGIGKSAALDATQSNEAISLLKSGFMPRGMGKSSAVIIWQV